MTGRVEHGDMREVLLVEREAEHIEDIRRRIAHVRGEDTPLFASLPGLA